MSYLFHPRHVQSFALIWRPLLLLAWAMLPMPSEASPRTSTERPPPRDASPRQTSFVFPPPAGKSSSPAVAPRLGRGTIDPREGTTSTLGFWWRADVDREYIDDDVMNNVDGTTLGSSDSERDSNDAPSLGNIALESSSSHDVDTINDGKNASIDSGKHSRTTDALFNNATDIIIDDDAVGRDVNATLNGGDRWRLIPSMPGLGVLLPGKPLFMRLIPISLRGDDTTDDWTSQRDDDRNMSVNDIELSGQQRRINLQTEQGVKDSDDTSKIGNDHRQHSTGGEGALILSEAAHAARSRSPAGSEFAYERDVRDRDRGKRRAFFRRNSRNNGNDDAVIRAPKLSKEELECPVVVANIGELQSAVLINKTPLRDVGFRFPVAGIGSEAIFGPEDGPAVGLEGNATSAPAATSPRRERTTFHRHDPAINGSLSSLLTYRAKTSSDPALLANYRRGIELLGGHPVLSIVRERVETKSKPGRRMSQSRSSAVDVPHLALVIEGGGMRGAVSAGMAAALSTLDLLDAFDSIHGSSAGAIVGAYLVSRQLCTDVYTDIMPAAGSRFASKRRGMVNFGVDWLDDVIQRRLLTPSSGPDVDESVDVNDENATSRWCKEDVISSIELAMGTSKRKQSTEALSRPGHRWSDDHYDGVVLESVNYLLSDAFGVAKSYIAKPLSSGVRRLGLTLRPALSAIDFVSSMRQYLKRRPGMNLTYIIDGVMDETHGLRPFDLDAFRANDQRQPLYVIASTVNNGGKGMMETVAFNSKDGDFFGSVQEDNAKSTTNDDNGRWFSRIWRIFKFVPYTLYSAARKAFLTEEFSRPMKDVVEAAELPSGTHAMYGFAKRHRIRNLNRPHEEKQYDPTGRIDEGGKVGIFPCLEASMLVPGAAGPPIHLIRSKNRQFVEQRSRFLRFLPRREINQRKVKMSHLCFDAFGYEPIPYRSAVEKANATHVLALRSRPDGCVVESRQHMYERVVAPLYFRKHGMSQVANLFSTGGSQYRYIEDVMTLNAGLSHGISMGRNQSSVGVKVPPTKFFYGTDMPDSVKDTDWRRAHLLPITLPFGSPELPTLCQDKDEVMRAVRDGYAAAFDVLAPIAGLPFDCKTISGEKVAKILFPDGDDDISVLKPVKIKSSYIGDGDEEAKRISFAAWITKKREARRKAKDEIATHPDGILARRVQRRTSLFHETDQYVRDGSDTLEYIETEALLAALPGFRGGRLDHIADNLLANEERKRK